MYKKINTSRKNKNKVLKLLSNKKNKNNIRLIIKKSKSKSKSNSIRKKPKSTRKKPKSNSIRKKTKTKSKSTHKKNKRKSKLTRKKPKSTKKYLKKNLKGGFYGKPFFQGINETGYGIESALTDTMSGLKGEPLSTSYDVTLQPDLKVSPDITDITDESYQATKDDYDNVADTASTST